MTATTTATTTAAPVEKTCTRCGHTKPVAEFAKDKRNRDGAAARCRECDRALTRARLAGGTQGAPVTDIEHIPVDAIRADGGTQMRARLNEETVAEYADAMREYGGWGSFKVIEVYHDGTTYWLADGFHRVAAAVDAGVVEVPAKLHAGDRRAAILHAAGANADHGLRRTNADKRRAVETLLRDEEWGKLSDGEIADKCKVDRKTVGNIRRDLISTMEIPELTTRTGADGKTRDVSNIGRKAEPESLDLTLDQAIALVWQVLKRECANTEDQPRLDWLRGQSAQFWRGQSTASWSVITAAVERVQRELIGRIEHARRTAAKQQARVVHDDAAARKAGAGGTNVEPEPPRECVGVAPTIAAGDDDIDDEEGFSSFTPTAQDMAEADAIAEVAAEAAEEDQERAARDAARAPYERVPVSVHPFEAWIEAMPPINSLYECRLLVELGGLGATEARRMAGVVRFPADDTVRTSQILAKRLNALLAENKR